MNFKISTESILWWLNCYVDSLPSITYLAFVLELLPKFAFMFLTPMAGLQIHPLFLYFLGACSNVLFVILVLSNLGSWRNQALSSRGNWWISWTRDNWGTNSQSKDNRTSYRGDDCSCYYYTETARENSNSSTFVKS